MNLTNSNLRIKRIKNTLSTMGPKNFSRINWASESELDKFNKIRTQKIKSICSSCNFLIDKRKMFYGNLSKGCFLCSTAKAHKWIIENKCNAACFYCVYGLGPNINKNIDLDSKTRTLKDIIEYIRINNLEGLSITGGEPLLKYNYLLKSIKTIKETFKDIYMWLYTNGILLTEEKIILLKKAGLDEIRIDIAAVNYNLDKVKLASNHILTAVEFPAIPEDTLKLKKTIKNLALLNINHCNLIQLEMSIYNFEEFNKRNYHIYPTQESPVVIESELCALEIMEYAVSNNIDLPIHYCGFPYREKNRHPPPISKLKNYESLSKINYLRTISIDGVPLVLTHNNEFLDSNIKSLLISSAKKNKKIEINYYDFLIELTNKDYLLENIILKRSLVKKINLSPKDFLIWYLRFIKQIKDLDILSSKIKEYSLGIKIDEKIRESLNNVERLYEFEEYLEGLQIL